MQSAEAHSVFLQNAAVHHHENSRLAPLLRGFFVDDVLLHPDGRKFQLNGLIDNLLHKLGSPENVYDVDLLRLALWHFQQRSVRFLAETNFDMRIHWDDAISLALHVSGNSVARTQLII